MKKIFLIIFIFTASSVQAHSSNEASNKFIGRKIVMQAKVYPVMTDEFRSLETKIGHAVYFNDIVSDCYMRFDRYYKSDDVKDLSLPAGTEFTITDARTYLSENYWGFPESGTMIDFNPRATNLKGPIAKEKLQEEMLYIWCTNKEVSTAVAKAKIKPVEKVLKVMSRKYNFIVQ